MTDQSGGYDPSYYAAIAAAEDRHFWFQSRERVLQTALAPTAGRLPSAARVLEVGCGTCGTLRLLERVFPSAAVVGMDLHRDGLRHARAGSRAGRVQGRLESAPFATPFQVVAAFDVIEHIERDDLALAAIHALLAPGGTLAVTVPAGPHLWSAFDVEARHCRRYTMHTLERALKTAGFTVDYLTPFMAAIYPIVWMARRRAPRPGVSAVDAELQPPSWINGLLTALLRPERALIGAGRRLPFGTSLLAVARRA